MYQPDVIQVQRREGSVDEEVQVWWVLQNEGASMGHDAEQELGGFVKLQKSTQAWEESEQPGSNLPAPHQELGHAYTDRWLFPLS